MTEPWDLKNSRCPRACHVRSRSRMWLCALGAEGVWCGSTVVAPSHPWRARDAERIVDAVGNARGRRM